jgi:hypothetical protein
MIQQLNATKIDALALRDLTYEIFLTEQDDLGQPLTRAGGGGDNGTRIMAFGQDDALRTGSSTLSNSVEYVQGDYL